VLHPQFKRAQFGHHGVDLHGNRLSCRKVGEWRQIDFEQAAVLQLTFGIRQDLSWSVAATDCRREESEFGGMPGEKTEVSSFDEEF
jgi:hypothetical protein